MSPYGDGRELPAVAYLARNMVWYDLAHIEGTVEYTRAKEPCRWVEVEADTGDIKLLEPSCSLGRHQFDEPIENGFNFCPYCGGKVEIA